MWAWYAVPCNVKLVRQAADVWSAEEFGVRLFFSDKSENQKTVLWSYVCQFFFFGRGNSTTKHAALLVARFNGWTLVYSNYFQFLTHLVPNIGCVPPSPPPPPTRQWYRKMAAITDFVASGRIWLLKTQFSLTCYKHPVVNFCRSFRHHYINVFLHVVYTYRRQPLQCASCDSGSRSGSWLELQAPSLTQPVRFPLEWAST